MRCSAKRRPLRTVHHRWRAALLVVLATLVMVGGATSQQTPPEGFVQINLQGEVKLEALVNYISQRLDVKFLYTTDISSRLVTIHTPSEVPVASLMTLLSSVLRSENLAIVDSDVPGWKRIVDVGEMALYAPAGNASEILKADGPAAPVTQVFVLQNLEAQTLVQILRTFLSKTGSNIIALAETNVLVVTDYSANVKVIEDLIRLIDRPLGESKLEFYTVKNQQSSTLVEQVQSILSPPQAAGQGAVGVQLFDEPYGNRIIAAGEKTLVEQAMQLLERLDISLGMTTRVYRLRNVTAERVDTLIRGYLPPQDADRTFQSTVDEDGNMLVVRATADIHRQLESLIEQLDQPIETADSPLRFYKLKNASAIDVLYSLLALQDAYGTGGGLDYPALAPYGVYSPFGGVPAYPGMSPLVPGAMNPNLRGSVFGTAPADPGEVMGQTLRTTRLPLEPGENGVPGRPNMMVQDDNPLAAPVLSGLGLQSGGIGGAATLPGGARISADVSTNSIIVVAPSSMQPMYARLIESLDQRRPQVLIEAKIVAVDTSDNYTLGVEVSVGDRSGDKRLFEFTDFGLSEVDPITGALRIIPRFGFNGTLVDPDVADVVVHALAGHARAKVLAAPKILVNDNSTGKLESVLSVPFQSVNASQTVSTTSLGGNQQAGTIITVTPHINEDDHLQLEFDVEFSAFRGMGNDELPPPRQIDRVGSTVTIPDGQTIIVGGLKQVTEDEDFLGVPWLEHIPVIRELSSKTDNGRTTTSFFLFIRPQILRDSMFRDLKFFSSRGARQAGIPGEFPRSRPLLIK